ncbi:hypothetical protein EBR61_03190 [bacterium]|nr:hypothetical protein [bacterium]
MIKVAEKAKDEVTKLMKHDGFDPSAHFIRVGVKSGGCSGLSYELKFDRNSSGDPNANRTCGCGESFAL